MKKLLILPFLLFALVSCGAKALKPIRITPGAVPPAEMGVILLSMESGTLIQKSSLVLTNKATQASSKISYQRDEAQQFAIALEPGEYEITKMWMELLWVDDEDGPGQGPGIFEDPMQTSGDLRFQTVLKWVEDPRRSQGARKVMVPEWSDYLDSVSFDLKAGERIYLGRFTPLAFEVPKKAVIEDRFKGDLMMLQIEHDWIDAAKTSRHPLLSKGARP